MCDPVAAALGVREVCASAGYGVHAGSAHTCVWPRKDKEYIYCVTRHDRWRRTYGGKPGEFSVTHRADHIDPVVWETVADAITQPQILREAIAEQPDSAEPHREELARCEALLQRLIVSENEISRAFRRGNLSAEVWNAQLKEIAADRRILERNRDAAREQLATADASNISIDDIETQLEELQGRVRAAAPKDRKAIIESVIPGDQPFGITIWPDGKSVSVSNIRIGVGVGAGIGHRYRCRIKPPDRGLRAGRALCRCGTRKGCGWRRVFTPRCRCRSGRFARWLPTRHAHRLRARCRGSGSARWNTPPIRRERRRAARLAICGAARLGPAPRR